MIKRFAKKTICILLLCLLALPLGGFVSFASTTTTAISNTLDYYQKEVFRQDWHWDTGNPNTAQIGTCSGGNACTTSSFGGGWQCHGFALYLANACLGSYPGGRLSAYTNGLRSGNWVCYTRSALGASGLENLGLQPGDVVRASSDASYATGHTAIVWKVENGNVYFAEAWGSRHSKINWGGFDYYSYSMASICSRFNYVALWRNTTVINTGEYINPSTCKHDYKEGHENTHPHEYYLKCARCGDKMYEGTYFSDPNCICCQGEHNFVTQYEDAHPHNEVSKCTKCGYIEYTGRFRSVSGCKQCSAPPSFLSLKIEEESIALGDLAHIKYRAPGASEVTINVYKDETLWKTYNESATGILSIRINEPGLYSATLEARNAYGTSWCEDTPNFYARAHVDGLHYDENSIYITYTDHLTRAAATSFATARKGVIKEFDGSHFVVEISVEPRAMSTCGQYRFDVIEGNFTYGEAAQIASLLGGNLAKITSEDENNAVLSALLQSGLQELWIGGQDEDCDGRWTWTDGSTLDYTNWSLSHSATPDKSHNWIAFYHSGQWCEATLGSSDGFVVEYGAGFKFILDGKGNAILSGYNGPLDPNTPTDIVIPDTYSGNPVCGLTSTLFRGMNIGTVTLPDGIYSVEVGTFANVGKVVCNKGSNTAYTLDEVGIEYFVNMPFTDVDESKWYYKGANWCYAHSIMSGTSETTFSPNSNLTRGQIVVILAGMSGEDVTNYKFKNTFTDAPVGKYYHNALEWAYEKGIVGGVSADKFNPNGLLSRQDLAVMLYKYALYANKADVTNTVDLATYSDYSNISNYAKTALTWAVSRGLISGTSQTTISPKSTATRGQICVIVANFCK